MQQQKKEYTPAEIRIIPFRSFDHFLDLSGELSGKKWDDQTFSFDNID